LLSVAKVADLANSWIHDQSQPTPANGQENTPEAEIPY
jgi:hypothetical protein